VTSAATVPPRKLLARPERWGFALSDPGGATPLEFPRRGAGAAAVVVAAMFVVFAGALGMVISRLDTHPMSSVASLMTTLFQVFWILGWSVGVLVLGALTVLLCFYRPATFLARGALIDAPRIGPLRMVAEYDLARMRNVRIDPEGGNARVRFDYGEGSRTLGEAMTPADAERIVSAIRSAMPAAAAAADAPPAAPMQAPAAQAPAPAEAARPLPVASTGALVLANLLPLFGVLLAGWRLEQVMLLFWAESGVIAFYTLLKMAIVGRWLAIVAGPFFLAHFGAFMAVHFLFIYELFLRGPRHAGPEPRALEALAGVFAPLWPALLALLVSHGISFAVNYLGRAEHRAATLSALMSAPYKRVMVMQLTLIAGGGLLIALHTPVPALALLVVLKIAADLWAHRNERTAVVRGALSGR
jgi:uncharacterized protein DUF6498